VVCDQLQSMRDKGAAGLVSVVAGQGKRIICSIVVVVVAGKLEERMQ